jgi:glucose-1-phosphate cytidylyltransferase
VKVVLFCGGLGMRIRDGDRSIPKPMVQIGNRPILWHLMKYYASFGHRDFVLCLGYGSELIKDYFLNYKEWISNDFVLANGAQEVRLLSSDIDDWTITFADTGPRATIGERLKAVEHYVGGEEMFLANYADGLTDLWLPDQVEEFTRSGKAASFMVVHSPQSFHIARVADDGTCTAIEPLSESGVWFNAGFFILRPTIFEELHAGEELVVEPFQRLIARGELHGYRFTGFWKAMDTFKDQQELEALHSSGESPWQVWRRPPASRAAS